jgi:DNA/RNA-binding domain of Phe-tRNA-synthetase-like protein
MEGAVTKKIFVSGDIFRMFPGYVRHVVVARGADNSREDPSLEAMLRDAESRVRSDDSLADLKSHPRVAAWRDAFARFGTNPNQCPPSVASLIKRVRGGRDIPYINSLVAIFNVISMRYILPAGGDDLERVKGDLALAPADGSETYVPLGSPDAAEHPRPGEIILYDTGDKDVFCRSWCWKNGDRSRIERGTSSVAVNIDALPPVTEGEGRAAADDAAELIRRFCGAEAEIHKLSEAGALFEIGG